MVQPLGLSCDLSGASKKITYVLVHDSRSPDVNCGPLDQIRSFIIAFVALFTVAQVSNIYVSIF